MLLSAGKDSVQSSTSGQLVAALAVDGNVSSEANACATTSPRGAQYWQVDLGDTYQMVNVTVINRCYHAKPCSAYNVGVVTA